tara:strand:- start:1247 stop:1744 length:498 start_codon:yes stop_codon:yes gene_type:complete
MAKIVSISDEIYRELGNPTDMSIATISFWLRTNVGQLNNLLNISVAINDTTLELSGTGLTGDQAVIFKKLYFIHFYDLKIRSTLGAAGTDSVIEVSSDGARVRKINKNELSKTWLAARSAEQEELTRLITAYRITASEPLQVAGDDTVAENEDTRLESYINRYKI